MTAASLPLSDENPSGAGIFDRPGPVCLGLALLTTAMLAPFAGKAFNIDDPIYLRTAEQILSEPGDFYGFEMNWFGVYEPAYDLNHNPPLIPYYLALVMWCCGGSEVVLHLALIPAAVGIVLGTYLIARRCGGQPLFSALLTLTSPFLLISATQIMCETLMTCFWVWSVLLWIRGHQENHWGSILAGAVVASLSIMTKFQAICLVPLLFAYSATDRSRYRYGAALGIPLAVLLGYEWMTQFQYGAGHFSEAISHTSAFEATDVVTDWEQSVVALAFLGGALLPVLFCLRWVLSLRAVVPLAAVSATAAWGCALWGPSKSEAFKLFDEVLWSVVWAFWLLVFLGCVILWVAAQDFLRERDRQSALLVLWTLGVFVFAALVNWGVNARTLLPLVPAAAILISRCPKFRFASSVTNPRIWPFAALLPGAIVALLLTAADYQEAETAKLAAAEIAESTRDHDGTVWFQGHWGFQWYMENKGGKALDFDAPAWEEGDILILPLDNANVYSDHPADVLDTTFFRYAVPSWASVMCPERGAGFYSDVWGPLPFNVGSGYPETYMVQVIVPPPSNAGNGAP